MNKLLKIYEFNWLGIQIFVIKLLFKLSFVFEIN